jgi:predicted nucleic acid-binding protein
VDQEDTIRIVIADTSVLINLAHTGHLGLLGGTPGYRFFVTDEVLAEVQDPSQKAMVDGAIADGVIDTTMIQTVEELAAYSDLTIILGSGESACLAVAQSRGWYLACDERRVFLREARARIGEHRLVNTPGLYILWIRSGILTVAEADAAKAALESRRFRMTFGSFQELV